ncbi:hypothetical protein [Alicyclobacillus pomorum]|uniref:hypothetical protein n=1 Tax=Alicyclobacillus pomorum TaxID=204470 RepID=UPI000418B961|nr:hypothetical protein [Alicyclobacillus pomorum]
MYEKLAFRSAGEVYGAERTGRVTKGALSRLSSLRGIRIFERRIQSDLELPVLRQAGHSAVGAFTSRDKPRSSDRRLQPILDRRGRLSDWKI